VAAHDLDGEVLTGARLDPDSPWVATLSDEGHRFVQRLPDVIANLAHPVIEEDGEPGRTVLVGFVSELLEVPEPAGRHSPRRSPVDHEIEAVDHAAIIPAGREMGDCLGEASTAGRIDTHGVRASRRAVRRWATWYPRIDSQPVTGRTQSRNGLGDRVLRHEGARALTYTPPPTAWEAPPIEVQRGPGLLVRAVWFVFVGWWLTAIMSAIAWAAMVTIIGLPLGIWLINRIPTFITLRPRTRELQAVYDGMGLVRYAEVEREQVSWVVRGAWFLLVGWWASALVMAIGYGLIVLVITLPLGLMLYNRVPFVASLYRY
jgi:uncharacterized membrane protein YccF (DUF307 family)